MFTSIICATLFVACYVAGRRAIWIGFLVTMAAGYFAAGKSSDRATFEMFVRRLPLHRNFILAAGLAQAVDYLLNFRFTPEEIAYLRTLPQFHNTDHEFFEGCDKGREDAKAMKDKQ